MVKCRKLICRMTVLYVWVSVLFFVDDCLTYVDDCLVCVDLAVTVLVVPGRTTRT